MKTIITPRAASVASPKPKGQIIWEALQRKEITRKEANEHTAVHVSETLHDHDPVPYVDPNHILQNYIQARVMGNAQYDQLLAIKNGEWVWHTTRLLELNKSNYDMLYWAANICKEIGASGPLEKLRSCGAGHRNINTQFPSELYDQALRVQIMDADGQRRHRRSD